MAAITASIGLRFFQLYDAASRSIDDAAKYGHSISKGIDRATAVFTTRYMLSLLRLRFSTIHVSLSLCSAFWLSSYHAHARGRFR